MQVDDEGNIWFRQSWLDTANRCAERGRLDLVHPDFGSDTSDAALIGTAAHSAIARVLNSEIGLSEIGPDASRTAIKIAGEQTVQWTKWEMPSQLAAQAARCAMAWGDDIMPTVAPGGAVEVYFKVPLFEHKGHSVGITGTIDYAAPDGTLYDWKTSSKKFTQREKQRTAIQPTVYAAAAMHGALGELPYEYPIRFHYGVMVRNDIKATTQIVDVQRTKAHEAWLIDKLRSWVGLAGVLGLKINWPMNDDHYLCSETWCKFWPICKGARLTTAEDLWHD